jgi:pyruvate,water dikinase
MANEIFQPEYQPKPYEGELFHLPIPDDFPVDWLTPDDARLLWELDAHYVKPRKKIDEALICMLCDHFLLVCNHDYDYPFKIKSWVVNNSLYGAYNYDLGPDRNVGIQKYLDKLNPVMENLMDIWDNEWLPEIKQHLAYWESFDLQGASMEDMLAHWDETVKRQDTCFNIRIKLFIPVMLGRDILNQTYCEIFPDASPLDGSGMLLEYGRNTKYDRDVWALSREVLASPVLKQAFEQDAGAVYAKLDESAEGQQFREKLDKYLLIYGKRGERGTLVMKSINPLPLIETLQDNMQQPDDYLENKIKDWQAQRDQRLQQTREKLKDQPQALVDKFELHLKMCENAHQLRELHNEWIDVPVLDHFRLIVQEFGRRLTDAGVLETPEDIVHLSFGEVRAAAAKLPDILDLRQRIAERKAEEAKFANVTPPAFMGAFPLDMVFEPDPVTLSYINTEAPDPVEVEGGMGAIPASPGKVRGKAKIIRNLYDIDKLESGDIMVVGSMGPSCTPLFKKAAAVLADIGGVLSHAAVLSREYGIPCIVGFRVATSVIQDGQLLEVDGDTGTVMFLNDDGSPAA